MIYIFSRLRCSFLSINRLVYKQKVTNMSRFTVRSLPTEERMDMSLSFSFKEQQMRTYNMSRQKTELLGDALRRLKTSIQAKANKKRKRKSPESEQDNVNIDIRLTINNEQVLDTVPNKDAFVEGAIFHIDGTEIRIIVNPPTVKSLNLPESIMAGFPVFPKLEAEFFNLHESSFRWFKLDEELSQDIMYTPDISDIGHHLKLVVIPKEKDRSGIESEVVSENAVNAGPGACPFEKRHLYTPEITEKDCFRVMTYNILADLYADSEYSRNELFSHCPPYALHIDYRKQLLLKEIKGYNADIICLQEVDKKIFKDFLLQPFEALGYHGELKQKAFRTPEGEFVSGKSGEGEAIFFRTSKFRLIKEESIDFTYALRSDPLFEDTLTKVTTNEVTLENLMKRTSVLQVLVLESIDDPSKKLCVANTHFFFHPKAGNIRLIHAVMSVRHLERVVQQYKTEDNTVSVIFCGDFNSTPQKGVNQFVTTGFIGADTEVWTENEGEELRDMEFTHSLKMISGCGYPSYTNFVGYFSGMLDYVFVDSDTIDVTKVVPNPEHEEVTLHKALPSVVFPSDHISQICDLKWKKSS